MEFVLPSDEQITIKSAEGEVLATVDPVDLDILLYASQKDLESDDVMKGEWITTFQRLIADKFGLEFTRRQAFSLATQVSTYLRSQAKNSTDSSSASTPPTEQLVSESQS